MKQRVACFSLLSFSLLPANDKYCSVESHTWEERGKRDSAGGMLLVSLRVVNQVCHLSGFNSNLLIRTTVKVPRLDQGTQNILATTCPYIRTPNFYQML